MKIIGITGPTGAGKTTALREMAALGAVILDCDEIYHDLLQTNESLRQELGARYGDVILPDGMLDRKKLGAVVFGDEKALEDLNVITHRYVAERVDREIAHAKAGGRPGVAVDAIALLESGLATRCDATVAVIAPAELRIRRIMNREGIGEDYARARVEAQKPDRFFRENCDYTLENNGDDGAAFGGEAKALFSKLLKED